jgi:hypothetical protein
MSRIMTTKADKGQNNDRNCPVRERTADGVSVGRCWYFCPEGVCPRHGDVSKEIATYQATGKLSEAPPKRKLNLKIECPSCGSNPDVDCHCNAWRHA